MDPDEQELLTRLNYAVFGVRGDNGILGRMDSLDRKFDAYVAAEEARRTDDLRREKEKEEKEAARARNSSIAAIAAVTGLLGIVTTLIVVLVTQV